MPTYKLYYFDVRGNGDVPRMIFAHADVAYEDVRVTIQQWPELKKDMLFGQMPVLVVDGHESIAQSAAISRFLARQYDLVGSTPIESAQIDMLADLLKDYYNDLRDWYVVAAGYKPGDKDQLVEQVLIPMVDKYQPHFEKYLQKYGSGFLVGHKVSWVDFLLATNNEKFIEISAKSDLLDKYPLVRAHIETINALPNIKRNWMNSRPPTLLKLN